MKYNFNQSILQLNGDAIKDEKGQVATIRAAVIDALSAPVNNESGEIKFKKYGIAQKIYFHNSEDDMVELTAEEVSLIKELVGKNYAPIIVGFIWNFLEGK